MLKQKALRKILVTTMSLFIIMTIYLIPTTEKSLETNLEFEYVTALANSSIYLLDQNNLLVKTKILLDNNNLEEDIKEIIVNLKETSTNKFTDNLKGVIPSKTKLNNITIENETVSLDFSKDLLKIDKDLSIKLIEALVYSLTELKEIEKVNITVDNTPLEYYPNTSKCLEQPLTRDIGINKEYSYTSLNDLTKVTVYYQELIDSDTYYVPVTKYLNNDKDKIDIIVEELTTSYIYEDNLQSILNEEVKLMDKEVSPDLLILDFNNALFDGDSKLKEEVLYTLSYSFFANYDVDVISYRVDGQEVENVTRDELV